MLFSNMNNLLIGSSGCVWGAGGRGSKCMDKHYKINTRNGKNYCSMFVGMCIFFFL